MNPISFWLYCLGGSLAAICSLVAILMGADSPSIVLVFFAGMFVVQTVRLRRALERLQKTPV